MVGEGQEKMRMRSKVGARLPLSFELAAFPVESLVAPLSLPTGTPEQRA
jgi:hypothetical protein